MTWDVMPHRISIGASVFIHAVFGGDLSMESEKGERNTKEFSEGLQKGSRPLFIYLTIGGMYAKDRSHSGDSSIDHWT